MQVKVLFFASAREVCGTSDTEMSINESSTLKDLLGLIKTQYPRLGPGFAVAVNKKYIRGDLTLQPGDEVAIIPPISGG